MTAIATLTMNPALDITTATPDVRPTDKLRCTEPRFDPGGGGINVARVVSALGGETVAIFPSAGPPGEMLQRLLADARVPFMAVPVPGQTRQSFTVDESDSGEQYRFVLPGPNLSFHDQMRVLDALPALQEPPAFLVVSGSLPPGVGSEFLVRVAELCRSLGARLVLDTSGAALSGCGGAAAFLMKPNRQELEEIAGHELPDDAGIAAAARRLIDDGCTEAVVVSLGADGGMLVTRSNTVRYPTIAVPIASAVGAGDSMVAGIVLALQRDLPLADAVGYGMAAGAAALITPGTELARAGDVERLYAEHRGAAVG